MTTFVNAGAVAPRAHSYRGKASRPVPQCEASQRLGLRDARKGWCSAPTWLLEPTYSDSPRPFLVSPRLLSRGSSFSRARGKTVDSSRDLSHGAIRHLDRVPLAIIRPW